MIRKLCLTLAVMSAASFSTVSAQQTAKVTASGIGYLEYLPQGYHSNSNKYPLVISLHGIKEKGTTSTDRNRVLADLPKVDNVGLPKYIRLGEKYPFILISPQLKSNQGNWSGAYIMQVLNYVKKHLRIDDRRIYLTGLSLGGFGVWKVAGDYPEVFAAIAPICPGGNVLSRAGAIAAADLPIWGFHGNNDRVVSHNVTLKMINAVNAKKPNPLAKATIFPGMGHVIWDRAYKETDLLKWMLNQRKGSSPSPSPSQDADGDSEDDPGNKSPVVKAGSDRTLVLPASSLYIDGSANDPDGKIKSYKWTQVSGRQATLTGTNALRLKAGNLKEGIYMFRLTVRDDNGAANSDDVRVIVKKSPDNKPDNDDKPNAKNILPVASAGPDRTITLPTNAVLVRAKASDKDGKIVSYEWTQTYGRRANVSGARTSQARISSLDKGKYIFRLRVKDNDGGTKDDFFKITVNGPDQKQQASNDNNGKSSSIKYNAVPMAYAGPDRVITLPTNSVSIQAHASDEDGRIVSYEWRKTYGNRASISGANSSRARIYNLSAGIYIFRLRVKDNDGKIKDDYFKVTVKEPQKEVTHTNSQTSNARPVANAGPDRRINVSHDSSIRLMGSGRDSDGRIVSYEWKKLAGPGDVRIRNEESARVTISNLKKGRYYFSLTVEDEDHARHVDKMAIRVTGS